MDSIVKKSSDSSICLLLGLIANCIFSTGEREICPLAKIRSNLNIEKKHKCVMGFSVAGVKSILVQLEERYDKRMLDIKHGVIHG
jgi:hypothetical protein